MDAQQQTVFEMTAGESPRATGNRSTLARAYENSRKSMREFGAAAVTAAVAAEQGAVMRLNTFRDHESRDENSDFVPPAIIKQASLLPSSIPQQIKLNLNTAQLLATKGEDIPNAEPNFALALKKAGERLELVINPVPDAQSLGSASVFHMLGKDGAKQPSVVYGSLGYVIDYLIAPHVGMQKTLASYIPAQLRRPSMNFGARAEVQRDMVKELVAEWVIRLWDAFLLSYKDACTTDDLVKELVSRFEKTTERKPGASERPVSMSIANAAFVQTSFELNNGHLVVARRALGDDEILSESSLTSKSARAVLTWMGLVAENRSSTTIRTNTLLFTLHWLRSSGGAIDLSTSRKAFDMLYNCATTGSTFEEVELATIARLILKDLRVIQEVCRFDRIQVEHMLGLDFDGMLCGQTADTDQFRTREMILCYASRPLPSWVFKAEPIFKRQPELVAAELTLMTYDLVYRHIHPLMLITEHARHTAAPVQDMIRWFRVLSYWPLSCIFQEGIKMPVRLQRLMFFLSLAEQMRKMGNFHALFGIMGGLTQPYAAWLWQALHAGDKAHKRFEDLKRAISSYGDYRVYKADLSHCHGKSRIPFLGMTQRLLSGLESEHSHASNHPHLYHFARQVARSAAINEFVAGQRHPYLAKSGYAYAVCAGPPGASPFQLHPEGVVIGSKHAQNPPVTSWNGTYSQTKLSSGPEIDLHFGVRPQVIISASFAGSVELPHDDELSLLLAWNLSCTLTEDAVKELSTEARNGQDEVVVNSLEAAGFM